MFLLEWINNYATTPKMEMTVEIEALYYAALLIITGIVAIIISVCVFVILQIKRFVETQQIKRFAETVQKHHIHKED